MAVANFQFTGHPVTGFMTRDARMVPVDDFPADYHAKLRAEIDHLKRLLKNHKATIKELRAELRKKTR